MTLVAFAVVLMLVMGVAVLLILEIREQRKPPPEPTLADALAELAAGWSRMTEELGRALIPVVMQLADAFGQIADSFAALSDNRPEPEA